MSFNTRYAAYAALALILAAAPAALYGQKSDPCAPASGYEHTTDNISKVSDETTKASTSVLSDSSKTADAINKFKSSIFGSKKTAKPATATPAATPAQSQQQAALASLEKNSSTGGAKAPEAGKSPCPASAQGNKLLEAKQTTGAPATGTTPPATPAPTPAAATLTAASKATVVEEGDGKHVVLTMPGQQDAKELTIIPNTKNMYLEESTGDKFLIAPDGTVTRIPHKTAQKSS
jgi:hypothetical protein